MIAKVLYKDGLRTQAKHIQSGYTITTDAPKDNHGKGEAFSPTDLVASALASCMLTIMGIRSEQLNISLEGVSAEVEKKMSSNPRRIAQITIHIKAPLALEKRVQKMLEKAALNCPVAKSLSEDLISKTHFSWL